MKYTTLTLGSEELKLRLTAAATIELEKKMKGNPLDIFFKIEQGNLPELSAVMTIIHAAAQKYNHGMTYNKILELYEDYVDNGNSYMDLIPVIVEVFKVSGFFKA